MSATPPPAAGPRWMSALALVALLGAGAVILRLVVTSPPSLLVETAGRVPVDSGADASHADTLGVQPTAGSASGSAADDVTAGLHGFVLSPASPAPDIAATDAAGNAWRLADRRGKVVALFFGYTSCPDVCPQTLALIASAKAALRDSPDGASAADAFEVAMITVDAERDTPDVLARYMAGFDPSFVGLEAGAGLQAIAASFGTTYTRDLPPDVATQAAEIAGHDEAAGSVAGPDEPAGHEAAGGDDHNDGTVVAPDGHSAGLPGGFERGSPAYTVAHSGVVFLVDPQGLLRSSYLAPFDPAELAADVTLLLEGGDRSAKAR